MIDRSFLIAEAEGLEAAAGRLRAMAASLAPPAPPVIPTVAAPSGKGLQAPAAFFSVMRRAPVAFPADEFNAGQVDGMNAILEACAGRFPIGWTAYVLATAYHETGATFETTAVESLNYSPEGLAKTFSRERISLADARRLGRYAGHPAEQEAIANLIYGGEWGRKSLGNIQPGDGWKFRGRSWPQLTGRANYQKADDALDLGGALMASPDLIGRLDVCAPVTRDGMREGWFTGVDLSEVIAARGTLKQFTNARRIINGTDKAEEIAAVAIEFQGALIEGAWL